MNRTAFLILITLLASSSIDAPASEVTTPKPMVSRTRQQIKSPPVGKYPDFYKKYLSANGFPILSSEKVSDYALLEAAYLIDLMLAKRPDVRKALIANGSRLVVMSHTEFTTDIPEHSLKHLGGSKKSAAWWNRRARGLGGDEVMKTASCGEENLLCFSGDPYAKENILIHEFAHMIHLRGMKSIDKTFDQRLEKVFQSALAKGLWKGKYAATNSREYFAEGVQSWFNNNRENDNDHNHVNTRKELIAYDPDLAKIVKEVYGDTKIVYIRPPNRKTQMHLTGYNYSKSPKFVWPKEIKDILKKNK